MPFAIFNEALLVIKNIMFLIPFALFPDCNSNTICTYQQKIPIPYAHVFGINLSAIMDQTVTEIMTTSPCSWLSYMLRTC